MYKNTNVRHGPVYRVQIIIINDWFMCRIYCLCFVEPRAYGSLISQYVYVLMSYVLCTFMCCVCMQLHVHIIFFPVQKIPVHVIIVCTCTVYLYMMICDFWCRRWPSVHTYSMIAYSYLPILITTMCEHILFIRVVWFLADWCPTRCSFFLF